MFLSRVRLDLNALDGETLMDVLGGRAYTAHQLLWRLFPAVESGARPFLYRQEMARGEADGVPRGQPLFYVLSDREPTPLETMFRLESQPFSPQLKAGDELAFRLRANPTVARVVEGRSRSQRSDVMMDAKAGFPRDQRASKECQQAMEQAALEWLQRQSSAAGFRLTTTPIISSYRQHELHKANNRGAIRFSSVDYAGRLVVEDPGQLIEKLAAGLGRAKAFGCGLLLVRRA